MTASIAPPRFTTGTRLCSFAGEVGESPRESDTYTGRMAIGRINAVVANAPPRSRYLVLFPESGVTVLLGEDDIADQSKYCVLRGSARSSEGKNTPTREEQYRSLAKKIAALGWLGAERESTERAFMALPDHLRASLIAVLDEARQIASSPKAQDHVAEAACAATPNAQMIDEAFEIADVNTLVLIQCEGLPVEVDPDSPVQVPAGGQLFALTNASGEIVSHRTEASQALQQAISWAIRRGRACLERDENREFVLLLPNPPRPRPAQHP